MDAFEPIDYHVKSPPVGGLFTWLSIRDDYRTLIESDMISEIELDEEYDDD